MAENPIKTPLPADLPEDWTGGQTVAPTGAEVGLSEQHGYNYLMEQVNAAQTAAKEIGEAFSGLATLGPDGKVPVSELPKLDYDPAGSAAAVQETLTNHINNKNNPHNVTAAQVGAASTNIVNTGWKLLWSKTTAGAENWVAPDLFGGKSYKIGVLVIGGGGSGGAAIGRYSNGTYKIAEMRGGSSGESLCFEMEVTPGASYPVVVGLGGEAESLTVGGKHTQDSSGSSGGASSFDGKTADGGSAGGSISSGRPNGAQPNSYTGDASFGGEIVPAYNSYNGAQSAAGNPAMCFNPFEHKRILGAGGNAGEYASKGGVDPITGLGGSDGVYKVNSNAVATAATAPGCGGGAASAYTSRDVEMELNATSGKGGDGAVYIYVQGVA